MWQVRVSEQASLEFLWAVQLVPPALSLLLLVASAREYAVQSRAAPDTVRRRRAAPAAVCTRVDGAQTMHVVGARATVGELEKAEKDKMKTKVEKICAHGCNVFINRQLIYNYPEQIFREKGVVAIEHSDFDGTERLS